jgi:hypothetical protein
MSFRLLSENVKITVYKTVLFCLWLFMGVKLWFLALREEKRNVDRVVGIFGPRVD